ncbi:NAD(P)/FAD-dependent oxidoreductase [Opitutaceae bacterium TAV3]|nr:NAD(P)/FAD-dependent oxidoreductase [Opitutaceae bacterium TAV3]
MSLRVLIVGGGAAGFFAAIRCAEAHPGARVVLYETSPQPLAKVRISGGGRCNVTHACPEPRELVKRYPRGARELLGPFHHWGPRETIAWFAARGVVMKTESDGRMFPVTDDSATIVDCLTRAATDAGVRVYTRMGVRGIERRNGAADTTMPGAGAKAAFEVTFSDGSAGEFDRVILATGGGRGSAGPDIAQKLGHTIVPPVPSLFTFHIDDARIRGLEGLSVPEAVTAIKGTKLRESGPLLVTHWGMSGPAVLKISAWGARELADCDYRCTLVVAWTGARTMAEVYSSLGSARAANPRKQVVTWNPFALPARLWERLVEAAGIPSGAVWTAVSNGLLQTLASQLTAGEFTVEGKSLNKEEFVTCGGVSLREVDFRTMESRVCPGLFFAGELLDIDGVTGGFNFQAAWTTGWIAGSAGGGGGGGGR